MGNPNQAGLPRRAQQTRPPATKIITNYYSAGGAISPVSISTGATVGARTLLFSVASADTNALIPALSIKGGGECPWLAMFTADAVNKLLRAKLTLDGVVVFDAVSGATVSGTGYGMLLAGYAGSGGVIGHAGSPIRWNTSFALEIAANATGANNIGVAYAAHVG